MQESALSHLSQALPARALLGPASSGRTTLLRHLAANAAASTLTLTVAGPQRLSANVLRLLLVAAGLDADDLSKSEMRRIIEVYIAERLSRGQRVVIAVDDADGFGPAAWREIERLPAAAAHGSRMPELLLSLIHIDAGSSPAAEYLRALPAPAIAVVSWLSPRDVGWYLHWRLSRFGADGLITPAAARLIAKCTRGCFASIDHLSQMALLLLRNSEATHVDVTLVRAAMRMLSRQYRDRQHPAADETRAELVVTLNGKPFRTVPLGDRLLIGRSPVNDLCLDSSYVSRHHATIVRTDSAYFLSDLNSINGVIVNGQRVRTTTMLDGDLLCIGPFRMKLRLKDEMPRRAAPEPESASLADTVVMPTPVSVPEPAHLKVIK